MEVGSYDECADLYDAAFDDITVRELEWNFIVSRLQRIAGELGRRPTILEIGCGNGQLLRQLFDQGLISMGTGLDASPRMIEKARQRHPGIDALTFKLVDSPTIPAPDKSHDLALSFLSFRYLDWKAIADEIERVADHFLMVDMATTVLQEQDRPLYEETRRRTEALHANRPEFARALQALVAHPAWHEMLSHHPRIAAEKYEEFLTSRFPKGQWNRLYVCGDHSLFTFETEP
jgi:SAM-dependent methyltransferase